VAAGASAREPDFCYLTTTGRRSGDPHRIEIWFASEGDTVYMLSGGRGSSDWVRNLMVSPQVALEIAGEVRSTRARVLPAGSDEDALARRLLVEKYTARGSGDLKEWGRTSLPVAFEWPSG
jgi:deazaflavin-dependent oxidoreductase (nitroreductase family)